MNTNESLIVNMNMNITRTIKMNKATGIPIDLKKLQV